MLLVIISFEAFFLYQFGNQIANPLPTPVKTASPVPTFPLTSITTFPSEYPTPIPTPTPVPQATTSSENWAGYTVVSNLSEPQPVITGLSASWVVPTVASSVVDTHSGVWIGVGGYDSDDTLIQVGTEQDSVGGQVSYLAWFEILPAQRVTIPRMSIDAGHSIQASIRLVDSSLNQWTIDLVDLNTLQEFHRTLVYNSSRLSAEWIVERPTINHAFSALANFGSVTFSDCQTTVENQTVAISSFPNIKFSMFESIRPTTSQLVSVGDLDSTGTEFKMSYVGGLLATEFLFG